METSPGPHWITLMPLPRYALGQVVKAPLSTVTNSVTGSTDTTLAVVRDRNNGLKWLEHGQNIWARLWNYVTPLPFSEPAINNALTAPIYRTWDCPNVQAQKPAGYDAAQIKVLSLLSANQSQSQNTVPLCNNEDVRGVGSTHIYGVLNLFLEMRYPNRLLEPIVQHPGGKNRDVILTFATPSNPNGLSPMEAVAKGVFYPSWTTTVRYNVTNGDSLKASGFADRILLREPKAVVGVDRDVAGRTNVAFSELKTFWAYPTRTFLELLNGPPQLLMNDGSVRPGPIDDNIKTVFSLLHQLWGQSHFLGARIGFVTNLDGVMVLLKDSTPTRSSFVLSSVLPWTDPRLLTCLIGLSFIALDVDDWKETHPELSLLEMLAPGGNAEVLPPHLPERRFVLHQRYHNFPLAQRAALQNQLAARAMGHPVPNMDEIPEEDDEEYN